MKWRDIHEWILKKDPAFFENVRGVPLEEIRKVEAERGVKLPSLYVDFLVAAGSHDGNSRVFGGSEYHDFHVLNGEPVPGEPARSKRYFLIAAHDETNDVAYIDTYLDLANGDDDDAPIVQAEAGDEAAITRYGLQTKESLSRLLAWWAFFMFETKDRSEQLSMFLHMNEYREELEPMARMQDVLSVLERRGFVLALPRLPVFACMTRSNASATVELIASSNMLSVYLHRDEVADTAEIVAELERRVPKLAVYETWRSSRFS